MTTRYFLCLLMSIIGPFWEPLFTVAVCLIQGRSGLAAVKFSGSPASVERGPLSAIGITSQQFQSPQAWRLLLSALLDSTLVAPDSTTWQNFRDPHLPLPDKLHLIAGMLISQFKLKFIPQLLWIFQRSTYSQLIQWTSFGYRSELLQVHWWWRRKTDIKGVISFFIFLYIQDIYNRSHWSPWYPPLEIWSASCKVSFKQHLLIMWKKLEPYLRWLVGL